MKRALTTYLAASIVYQMSEQDIRRQQIAKLRMERDIAEALYKSALEAINIYKLKVRIMENQYDKEWGNTN